MRSARGIAAAVCVAAGLHPAPLAAGEAAMAGALELRSPRFPNGGEIPREYTCEGRDLSPPLVWSGVPAGTRSLALIVDDPDAPDPRHPQRTWVHWVVYDLPPDSTGLAEGIAAAALPDGTREGRNDWKRTGWGGPCPPIGRHRYFFELHALDRELGELGLPTAQALERAMRGHVLERAELVGTYEKGGAGPARRR